MQQPLPLRVNNEQDDKITELSSKLSTYEDRIEKLSITETQIHPLSLQITEISYKLSAIKTALKNDHFQHLYILNINEIK